MSDRKRSPNWQMPEKILLVDLVTEHFSIVENKRTDAVTMKQKHAEWVKISDEFNSQTSFGHRTAENLKAQWESLKKTTKKEWSAARQNMIQTGGGPAKPKCDDPLFSRILSLISTVVVGLVNEYDSDNIDNNHVIIEEITSKVPASVKIPDLSGTLVPNCVVTNSTPLLLDIDISEPKDDESQGDTADWGDYTPKMLQTPKSAPLRSVENIYKENGGIDTPQNKNKTWSSKRRPALPASSTSQTLEELHKKKIKATEIQMTFAAEEREEAKKLFDIELKIKNELLKQEKIKTQLLLAQLRRTKYIKGKCKNTK